MNLLVLIGSSLQDLGLFRLDPLPNPGVSWEMVEAAGGQKLLGG